MFREFQSSVNNKALIIIAQHIELLQNESIQVGVTHIPYLFCGHIS